MYASEYLYKSFYSDRQPIHGAFRQNGKQIPILQMCRPTYAYSSITYRLLNLFLFHIHMRSTSIYPYLQKHTQTTFRAEEGTRSHGKFFILRKGPAFFPDIFCIIRETICTHIYSNLFPPLPTAQHTCAPSEMAPG